MTYRLNPFIYFGDTARQAMEFYRDVFGGNLAISTFAEFGQADSNANKVMHAQLETSKGFTLMASDTPQGMELKPQWPCFSKSAGRCRGVGSGSVVGG